MDKKLDFDARLFEAKEAEIADHQHEWEAAILTTLAYHINSDLSELKWRIMGEPDESDLERSDYCDILRAMKALHDQGDGVDQSTVKDWLTTNGIDIADSDLDAIFHAEPIDAKLLETYMSRIVTRGRFRQAKNFIKDVLDELELAEEHADITTVDDAVAKVQAAAFNLQQTKRLIGEIRTEAERLDSFMMDMESRKSDRGFLGIDSGFNHLNQSLNGVQQGLVILAGSPSGGKTTYAKQIGDNVAEKNDVPVLIVSYEQSADELRIKTLARLSKVNTQDISKGRTEKKIEPYPGGPTVPLCDQVEKAVKDYKRFGRHIRIIEADRDTTIAKIRIIAQAFKQQAKAEQILIIIDYLQIVPVSNPRDFGTTKDKIDWICSELRRLARDLKSPIIAISSENRDAYRRNKKPTLAAFKETGGIEYSADVACALWTDAEATQDFRNRGTDTAPDHRRAVNLLILKNRNGELAEIKMVFHPEIATFTEKDRSLQNYADSLGEEQS